MSKSLGVGGAIVARDSKLLYDSDLYTMNEDVPKSLPG
jgi:hypothetical protein